MPDEPNQSTSLPASKAPEETPWGAGKKTFVTTLVAILLNPVSAGVGYYMNNYLQRPSFDIRYLSTNTMVEDAVFPQPAWMALQKDQSLVTQIREGLTKLITDPNDSSCVDWLDKRESWLDGCLPLVNRWIQGSRKATQSELAAANTNLKILSSKQDIQTEGLVPMQSFQLESLSLQIKVDRPSALANLRSFAETLQRHLRLEDRLSEALDAIDKASDHTPRTGEIKFTAGVLNSGDRDGVLSNRAYLAFDKGKVWLFAQKYTPVKAHSFEEIEFSVGGDDDQGKSQGTLKALVISGDKFQAEIELDSLPKKIKKGQMVVP